MGFLLVLLIFQTLRAQENSGFSIDSLPCELQNHIKLFLPPNNYVIMHALYSSERITRELAEHIVTDGLKCLFLNLVRHYKIIKEENCCIKQASNFRYYKEKKLLSLRHAYEHCPDKNKKMLLEALDKGMEGKLRQFEPYMTLEIKEHWGRFCANVIYAFPAPACLCSMNLLSVHYIFIVIILK